MTDQFTQILENIDSARAELAGIRSAAATYTPADFPRMVEVLRLMINMTEGMIDFTELTIIQIKKSCASENHL